LARPKRFELVTPRFVVWVGYSRQLLVSTTIFVSDETNFVGSDTGAAVVHSYGKLSSISDRIGSASVMQGHIDAAPDLVADHVTINGKDFRLFDPYGPCLVATRALI